MSGTLHNKLFSDIEPPSTPLLSSLLPSSHTYVLLSLHVQHVDRGQHMSKQNKYTSSSTSKLHRLYSVQTRRFVGPTKLNTSAYKFYSLVTHYQVGPLFYFFLGNL